MDLAVLEPREPGVLAGVPGAVRVSAGRGAPEVVVPPELRASHVLRSPAAQRSPDPTEEEP